MQCIIKMCIYFQQYKKKKTYSADFNLALKHSTDILTNYLINFDFYLVIVLHSFIWIERYCMSTCTIELSSAEVHMIG